MAITLVGTFGAGVDTGNLAVTLPAGISFGDAVGAVGICSNAQTITAPAGWTVRAGFPADGGNARMYAWVKDAVTASDAGATATFTNSGANKVTVAGFVLHSGNGFAADWTDDLTFTAHSAAGTSYTAPASTSTQAGDWGVAVFGARGTNPTAWTPAAGLTERQDLTRTGSGATTLHLADSNGSVGAAAVNWGPFTETNISTSAGGGLTWLVKELTSGTGGTGGGGASSYPKMGLWRQRDGTTWRNDQNAAENLYGAFQGHWSQYWGAGDLPISAEVEQAFRDGKDIHVFWKAYDVSWADTAAGNYNTEIDQVAADVIALCAGTGRKIWLTIHHEPENDFGPTGFTAANWRAMWGQVRARFDSAGASQYVTWVAVFMNSHTNASGAGAGQDMISLWGNDGVMDTLVDVVSQQDYIPAGTTPATLATKWLEDLEFLKTNDSSGRHWSYVHKPQAFTEWGADLGGVNRGTNTHRAQTIDAIRGILPDLAARNVVEIRYFDARTNIIDDPPSVDGVAFAALKAASEAGQSQGGVIGNLVALARDGLTATSNTIPFTLPSGWQQGDLAIVWLSTNAVPDVTVVPTGWTLNEGPVVSGANVQRAWRYSKVLAAGEPNPTWTISQSVRPSGIMVLLRGAGAVHATSALTATASSTSHSAAAVTTTAAESYVLTAWLFRWADASGNGGVNYGTAPGTHTVDGSVSPNSGVNPGAGGLVAHLTVNPVGPGTYGPYVATVPVASTGITGQLAVLPAGTTQTVTFIDAGVGADAGSGDIYNDGYNAFGGGGFTVTPGAVNVTFTDTATSTQTLVVTATGPPAPEVVVPTARVYLALSAPMATTPTWVDITAYGQWPIEITRGRNDERSSVEPGTMRLRVNNADGRFTMGKTDGAYYPWIRPGARIKVELTYQAQVFARFDGHVNGFPTEWIAGREYAYCDLTATDRLKRFGQIGEFRSMLEEEILRDTPQAYYPLGEAEGSSSVGNITPSIQAAGQVQTFGVGGGQIAFADGIGPGTDDLAAPIFTPNGQTGGQYLVAEPVSVGSSSSCWLECWFNTTAVPSPNQMAMAALSTSGAEAFILGIWITGQVQVQVIDNGSGVYSNASPNRYNDGRTHQALASLTRSGSTVTVRLYIDGALVSTGSYTGDPLTVWRRVDIGASHLSSGGGNTNNAPYSGTLSHVAAGTTIPTAARILAHYQAGALGMAGERTDQRIARFADWIAIPTADRALDVGDKLMGPQQTSGTQPLEAMREAEQVEQGVLYVNGAGRLVFHRRGRRYNVTTPAVTLNALSSGEVHAATAYPGDDSGLVNDVEATRTGGARQRALNQASIDNYGLYRDSVEVPAQTDSDALAVAQWRVGNYADPLPVPSLTVNLAKLHSDGKTSLVLSLLNLDISSLVRLTNMPTQAPSATDDQVVEGWTETLDIGGWQMVFTTSPNSVNTVAVVGTAVVGTSRVAL